MKIRQAKKVDVEIIKELAEIIWPICYREIISAAQIQYMLGLIYSSESLKAQMKKGHYFIIAYEAEIPVGFASYSSKSLNEATTFRLHKIYVITYLQTTGIGSALLEYVITQSKIAGANLLELNVNKYNLAKSFYDKKGFTILKEEIIDIGNGYVMDDYIMGLSL